MMIDGPSNSESAPKSHTTTNPDDKNSTDIQADTIPAAGPATLEQMLSLRAEFDHLLHAKKPVTKDQYDKLMGEIETYAQNPYRGNEIEENPTSIKPGFLASVRRKLGF